MKIYCILVLLFFSCTKKIEIKPVKIFVDQSPDEFQIPKAIFDELKNSLGKDNKVEPEYLFTNLDVLLFSEQEGVLKHPQMLLKVQKGGSTIDLVDFVKGPGTFYLSFPEEQFKSKPALSNLFYISNAPHKVIDNSKYGLGCGHWVDLKTVFGQLQDPVFLKLNSTLTQSIYVLAGHYIFAFKKGTQIYLTHLTIKDSRIKNSFCNDIFKTS